MDQNLALALAVGGGMFVLIMGGLWKLAYDWPKLFGRVAPILQALNFGAIMGLLGFNQGVYLASVVAPGAGLTGLAFSAWWALVMIGAMLYIFCLGRFVTTLKPRPEKRRKRRSSTGGDAAPV
jgi:hypothetical protein